MASPPPSPKPSAAPPPPSSQSPRSSQSQIAPASRKPAQSSFSKSETMWKKSPSRLAFQLDTPAPPLSTPCSAPAEPFPTPRTALRLRSNQSPAQPAPAPAPFSLPTPAPRDPQNYLSSNPPASPNRSPPAKISAHQSPPSCSTCNPPRSKSVPPQFAPHPAQSFPPDGYRKLRPHSPICPKRATHLSTASKSQIPNHPYIPCAKYPPPRPRFSRAPLENISGSQYSHP